MDLLTLRLGAFIVCGDLARQLAASQVGSILLARLEFLEQIKFHQIPSTKHNKRKFTRSRNQNITWSDWNGISDPKAVNAAVDELTKSNLCDLIRKIQFAVDYSSPWNPDSDNVLPRTKAFAKERLPIAEVIINRFYKELAADINIQTQVVWDSKVPIKGPLTNNAVYDQGQFTWSSIRSMTTPIRHDILDWILSDKGNKFDEICYKPVISNNANVYEIHSFENWRELVICNSMPLNSSLDRRSPDWRHIAKKYDAVHLSWMGILLAHDNLDRAKAENIIPLRYWEHEQTHWLTNCIHDYKKLYTYKDLFCNKRLQ